MFTVRSVLRLGVLLLAFFTLFCPIGVGARADVTCDDFANPDAAQVLLDAAPDDYEDVLDPDGDGIACNDESGDEGGDTNLDAEAAEYLDDVREHADELVTGGERLFELLQGDFTEDEAVELLEILDVWTVAEDEAAQLTPPDGYEDVQNAYEDVTAAYAASVDAFYAWVDGSEAEQEENLDAFITSVETGERLAAELDELIAEYGG